MALTNASVEMSFGWAMARANAGFLDTVQGPETLTYELEPDTGEFGQAYVGQLSIPAGSTVSVDLQSFTSLVQESVTFTGVIAMLVVVSGEGDAACKIEPNGTNGFTWFWTGTTPAVTVPAGGAIAYAQPSAKTVDATHKVLDFTNVGTGGNTAACTVIIFGRAA